MLLDELRLRSIEVLDTRPVGGPECTVKMMQVDILIEMMDVTKAPPTLLIISDNRSMTYPVSLLRNRLRKVELITSAELTEAVQHVRTAPADPLASLVSTEPSGEALRDDALPIQHAAVALNTAPLSPAQREDGPAIAIPLQSVHLQTAPHQYVALVQAFDAARVQFGKDQVPKSQLGNLILAQSRRAYGDAGVSSFKRYIEKALRDGMVEVGQGEQEEWVALKQQWAIPGQD